MSAPKKVSLSCLSAAKHLLIRSTCNFSRFQCLAKKSQYNIYLIQLNCSLATFQLSNKTYPYSTPLGKFNLCKFIKFSLFAYIFSQVHNTAFNKIIPNGVIYVVIYIISSRTGTNIQTNEQETSSLLECFLQRVQKIFEIYSNIQTNERETSSLLECFLQRRRVISVVCDDCYFSSTKECGLPPQREYLRFTSIICI